MSSSNHFNSCSSPKERIEDEEIDKVPGYYDESWFGGLTASINRIKDKIPPQTKQALDGIADAIQRSATAIAAEFSQMEMDAEWEARRWMNEHGYGKDGDVNDREDSTSTSLPWQEPLGTEDEGDNKNQELKENEDLKKRILALSLDDDTFCKPFKDEDCICDKKHLEKDEFSDNFDLDSHLDTIRRLLDVDLNLSNVQKRLVGNEIKERTFWRNYFYHCEQLRRCEKDSNISENKDQKQDTTCDDIGYDSDIEVVENDFDESQTATSSSARSNENDAAFSSPRTLSMGDFVLVGGDDEDLEHIAADIVRENTIAAGTSSP